MNNQLTKAEEWRPVVGMESYYEVSSQGRVRSLPRDVQIGNRLRRAGGQSLSAIVGSRGYLVVNLSCNGRRTQVFVHKLVLEAFSGPRPKGLEACHNDGDRLNCALSNLRWDTRSSNHGDKVAHGTAQRGERANNVKLTDELVLAMRSSGLPAKKASKRFGTSKTNAARILRGQTWRHLL